jgi:hydroxypyruvate isomerase
MGATTGKPSIATGKEEFKNRFVDTCRKAVDVAKRCNAKWMTVVPGFYERNLPMGLQTAHVIDALRKGAAIFEPHGLIMVLEPLSDTPDLFLRYSDQTYMICKAVNSPSCKLLFDMYHMQRNEGNIIKNMDACWDEIAYLQIGDNPGRNEPTTGEMNYKNIFQTRTRQRIQRRAGHGTRQCRTRQRRRAGPDPCVSRKRQLPHQLIPVAYGGGRVCWFQVKCEQGMGF